MTRLEMGQRHDVPCLHRQECLCHGKPALPERARAKPARTGVVVPREAQCYLQRARAKPAQTGVSVPRAKAQAGCGTADNLAAGAPAQKQRCLKIALLRDCAGMRIEAICYELCLGSSRRSCNC